MRPRLVPIEAMPDQSRMRWYLAESTEQSLKNKRPGQ
jgi:hypothetical protein